MAMTSQKVRTMKAREPIQAPLLIHPIQWSESANLSAGIMAVIGIRKTSIRKTSTRLQELNTMRNTEIIRCSIFCTLESMGHTMDTESLDLPFLHKDCNLVLSFTSVC